ncbi:MAG: ClpXP adapter SpxH family protein [Saprospiraceae bacterium]|nr:ClpXP adapter SpxH family protein [Saprospiraceae bacterium]
MRRFPFYPLFLFVAFHGCHEPNHAQKMNNSNPLLCDPVAGACDMPASSTHPGATPELPPSQKPIRVLYFTDPVCSSCWGIEPQLRRLKLEYGDALEIEYRMGGLLPSWEVYNSGGISKPSDVSHHWDEVSGHYEMPIDGDVWLEDPLPSSYPPSIAFKAAQMQDAHKAILFLRRIREMVFMEKKNITRWEHLQKAAEQVGLDANRMKADVEGRAADLFQEDLALARSMKVRGFPTLFFTDANDQKLVLYGVRPYDNFVQTIRTLYPEAVPKTYDRNPEALFARYPTLTLKEYSILADVEKTSAQKILSELVKQKRIQEFRSKNGSLWRWNDR